MARAVFTDVPGKPGGFWGEHTMLIGPQRPGRQLVRIAGPKWAARLAGLAAGLQLFARRSASQGIVTFCGPAGLLFAWLQTLVPWGRRPHAMVDCNWYLPARPWQRRLKAAQLRLAARSVQTFVVWARHEIDDYSRAFGLAREKFQYVPFHTTLDSYAFEVSDQGYLFAGGNYDRDYRTLVEAVRPLDVPTWLATTRPEQLDSVHLPAHVRVAGTDHAGFRQAMAGARLVVVPMQKGLLHSGGQQTLLNAMWMGKPTIAVGRRWAKDFVTDGDNGLIVDYEDVVGLRTAIRWVLEHPEEAKQMAARGQTRAQEFPTRRCMESLYRLVIADAVSTAA
jgi:glycosyltransferase involved in cell wall biosynthesis